MKLSDELRRLLRAAGCELVRQGRGDHEIWRSPKTGAVLVIDDGMKSRHIANRILRAAGLPKAFSRRRFAKGFLEPRSSFGRPAAISRLDLCVY